MVCRALFIIMVAFDKYQGPAFLTERERSFETSLDGLWFRSCVYGRTSSSRTRPAAVSSSPWWCLTPPLFTCTKASHWTRQCDISGAEFASGLHYVAVSRASKLQGLMFNTPISKMPSLPRPSSQSDLLTRLFMTMNRLV